VRTTKLTIRIDGLTHRVTIPEICEEEFRRDVLKAGGLVYDPDDPKFYYGKPSYYRNKKKKKKEKEDSGN